MNADHRVFVSYAWEDEEYRTWVERLAVQLRQDGVHARLDVWDRQDGQSLSGFLSSEVEDAHRVLVLASPQYCARVRDREHGRGMTGVGWEWDVLTTELFQGVSLAKLVVARTRGELAELPSLLRRGPVIDLTVPENLRVHYDELLARLTDQRAAGPVVAPRVRRVGRPPVAPLFEPETPAPRSGSVAAPTITPPLTAVAEDPLASLRQQVQGRADRLPEVFRREGGPQALSEVFVEVRLAASPAEGPECDGEPFWRRGGLLAGFRGRKAGPARLPDGPFHLERVLEWPAARWVLLGDPGCGKTWLLHHLALQLMQGTVWLPVLLKVAEVLPGEGLDETVGRVYGRALVAPLRAQVAARRVVLLLDGLDEVLEPATAGQAVLRVAAAAPGCPLLVASRPTGFQRPAPEFVTLAVCPLGEAEQLELLSTWVADQDRAARALERLQRRPRLRRLAENPLLLTLVGLLLREGREIPEQRGELYDLALRLLLARGAQADRTGRPLRAPTVALDALAWLALRLHGTEGETYPVARLRAALREQPRLAGEIERVWGDPEALLTEVAEITGLLVPDAGSTALTRGYQFPHRTFREQLAALALTQELGQQPIAPVAEQEILGAARRTEPQPRTIPPGELGRVLADGVQRPARWSEVLALAIGLLGAEAGDALLRQVAATGCGELTQRVVAEAEGLAATTVQALLGMDPAPGAWQDRRKILEELPDLVGDLAVTVGLAWRFAQGTTNGNDLFFVRELLQRIAASEVAGTVREGSVDAVRREAAELAARVLDHLDPSRREQARAEVRRLLRPIPAGRFRMGSPSTELDRWNDEGPQHPVELVQGFELLAVPVTHRLFELFDPGHQALRDDFQGQVPVDQQDEHPVYNVTWYEAQLFAEWVGGRLPLEAEWEYACRAGTTSRYWSGNGEAELARVGWYEKNSGGHTHPVGEKPCNPWGLWDMHGNVREWCHDPWVGSYQGRERGVTLDPARPVELGERGVARVVRGGSWNISARVVRSACRSGSGPGVQWQDQGFRVLLPPSQLPAIGHRS